MIAVQFAADLVEETVLLAERGLAAVERRSFRHERDRLYGIEDVERREEAFRSLHNHWFLRLEANRSIELAIAERMANAERVAACRVVRAIAARDEGADLVDRFDPGTSTTQPVLVIRLRPSTLIDASGVRRLLRHELMHVADMLDPAFGYERDLPPTGSGPSADAIVRDRYRVLWDVTIDGRLARAGEPGAATHADRWREFAEAFPMLGSGARASFDRWFGDLRPTHGALAAFARSPLTHEETTDEETVAVAR